jgi:putative transposase
MNRGGGRRDIFIDERDRRRFLALLAEAHERFGFELHAFCLMGNHFHLLARTPLANVGEALHHITSCYASWSNDRRGTDGSLFRGRYLAKHVDADNYLLHVSRYIHLNPVEAKMVTQASEYPWSSMASYLGLTPKPEWLFTGQVLTTIGGSTPRVGYGNFVADGEGAEDPAWYQDEPVDATPSGNGANDAFRAIDDLVAKAFAVDVASIRHGKNGRENLPRMVAVGLSRELTGLQLRQLATHYNFGGPSGIHRTIARLREVSTQDDALERVLTTIRTGVRQK